MVFDVKKCLIQSNLKKNKKKNKEIRELGTADVRWNVYYLL